MSNTDFSSNPQSILDFMNKNLVLTYALSNSSVYGRPQKLELEDSSFNATITSSILGRKKSCDAYNLVHCRQDKSGFFGYICDYKEKEINYQVLGNEADFCFTMTMNGCTFGIGSPTSDGSILVTHCNTRNYEEIDNGLSMEEFTQAERQRILSLEFLGKNGGLFEPSSYMPNKENATTFGVRINGEWKFYYQSYVYMGNQTYQLNGVFPINLTKFSI